MRGLLTRDVPTMVIIPTLKTQESYLMKIIQPYLVLPPPETTVNIMMIQITHVTLTTFMRKKNLSSKSSPTACQPTCQKTIFKNVTQSNLLNKPPENKQRSACTAKNARTMIAHISTATTQNLLSKS